MWGPMSSAPSVALRRELLPFAHYAIQTPTPDFATLMCLRHQWAEIFCKNGRPGLTNLEDKLAWHDLAAGCDVECLPVIARFGDRGDSWRPEELADALHAAEGPVCMKPSHLTLGKGVFIVKADKSIRRPEPSGPMSAAIATSLLKASITLEDPGAEPLYSMAVRMHELMGVSADDMRNCRPRKQVPPRAFVEEAVECEFMEVHCLIVFSECVAVTTLGDPDAWRKLSAAVKERVTESALRLSRHVRADLLRVDFLVRHDGNFTLNDACSWLWPNEKVFSSDDYKTAYDKLMDGYRMVALPNFQLLPIRGDIWMCTETWTSAEPPTHQTQQAHFYVVLGTHTVAIVDSGTGRLPVRAAAQYALGPGGDKKRIIVILTQGLRQLFGVGDLPVYAHRLEEPLLANKLLRNQITWVEDGMRIELGGKRELRIIHTPGRSPGSISVASNSEIFVGGAFLDGSGGAAPMLVSNAEDYAASLRRIAEEAEQKKLRIYPGHGAVNLTPDRVREAASRLSEVMQLGSLGMSKDDVMSFRMSDVWSYVEWDDSMNAPLVQAGKDFTFAHVPDSWLSPQGAPQGLAS